MPVLPPEIVDPDRQMALPFQAAIDYAQQVMQWAQTLPQAGLRIERDIAYGSDRLQRYDVYAPADARNAPVLVFWHGGGWTNGYRAYNAFMAPHLVRMGFVLVSPSYRLAPAHPLPAAFDDALAALAHVQQHISEHGGAGGRLYLGGHSAGGHLCALAALRPAARAAAGVGAKSVRGCLPISGIMDLHHAAPQPGSLEERVYTMVLRRQEDDAPLSPLCWCAENTVPIVLSYGERDSERVQRSNRRLDAVLQLQPALTQLHMEAGADHFQTHVRLKDPAHPWYARLKGLVERG